MTKGSNKGIKEGKGQRIENANYHCSNISLSAKNFADKGLKKTRSRPENKGCPFQTLGGVFGGGNCPGRETKK